jgi:uncharacterized membrane protein
MEAKVRMVARGAAIAALYATATVLLEPISYGMYQVRVSEALTLLPVLWPEAVPGLFVGCAIANIFGGNGPIDVVLGSMATLVAAMFTRLAPNRYLAATAPVAVNAVVVGAYLSFLLNAPLLLSVFYVGCGEAVACYALGLPLLSFLKSRGFFEKK